MSTSRFAATALLLAAAVRAQEVRATLTGAVNDSSGSPVPGVTVIVTNTATNLSQTQSTNEAGLFNAPFLQPGNYRVTAEKAGFKRYVNDGVVLQAQDRARLDISLELGDLAQSVTVSTDVSLLQTETASRSQVIANELITQIPTQGRNPFQIAWAAPGVIKTGGWRYLRSFDIAGTSNFAVNGGRNRENEVLLDGISNVRGNRTVIHVPTMESVQEFKVNTNTYDAQYGRTGGGVVSIVTKSGGNAYHGTLFEYFQNSKLNANQTELNRAGVRKPPNNINTFGAQVSGPVWIPKVIDLRNKLFWLVSYEGMRQRSADPGTRTFATPEFRQGDFSALRNAQNAPILVYDPLTTAADGTRTPFAGNRIPSARINPIAARVMQVFPLPNAPGDTPARLNNYIFPSRWIGDMDQWIGRMDYALNDRNRVYFRYGQNPFQEFRGLVFVTDPSQPNPAEPTGNAPLIRNGRNWTMDWTSTLTPRMTFNLRAGLARWEETTGNSFGANFNPRQLGFPDALVSQFTRLQYPRFDLGTFGQAGSDRLLSSATNDSYTVQPNFSYALGKHILKFGAEGRRYNDNTNNPGFASGNYSFGRNWTQARALQPDAVSGNEVATFLLGYPTSGVIDRNIDPAVRNHYFAVFFQDDFKVTSRLTLNLGLRWDYERPATERYDRSVRTLDLNAPSPIANRVQGLNLRGAVQFNNRDGQPRGAFTPDRNNFQPRVGAAYRIGDKWVVRGGYGIYYLGQNEIGPAQGFSQPTQLVPSTDGNLTPAISISNPIGNLPGGRLLEAVGASQGAASFLGQGITANFINRALPSSHQYSFDIERELPGGFLVEAAYVGNLTRRLPVSAQLNVIPANLMNRTTATGAIDTAWYTERVPNPLAGLIPVNANLNGATIPRQNLLFPFPQFTGVTLANVPIGRQRHDGFLLKVNKRLSKGLSFLASYGVGKTLEQVTFYNQQDLNVADPDASRLEKRSADQIDIPQKFTIAGVYDLPFKANGPLGVVVEGWSLNANITYQSGWAAPYPNAAQITPGSAKIENPTLDRWFDTSKWRVPGTALVPAYQLRNFPTLFPDVRVPGYRNWDISAAKRFPIHEQLYGQFRFELVNAFNTPWYTGLIGGGNDVTNANFGRLNFAQGNLPRFLKLGLHVYF